MPETPDIRQGDELRSLSRLLIGAVDIGIAELRLRLRKWEDEIESAKANEKIKSDQAQSEGFADQSGERQLQSDELLRYALIGMVFDAQEIVKRGSVKVVKVGKRVQRRTEPMLRPLVSSRLLSPARKRYRRLVSVGRQRVDRWIEIGREEETHSRVLAQTALAGTVEETVDYLAEYPGIRSLIETQTTGLADEIIEEMRERTVAADIVLEGFMRALFRRKPRHTLPPPPADVQMSAVTLHPSRKITMASERSK